MKSRNIEIRTDLSHCQFGQKTVRLKIIRLNFSWKNVNLLLTAAVFSKMDVPGLNFVDSVEP